MDTVFVEYEWNPSDPRYGKVKGVYRQRQEGYAEAELAVSQVDVVEFYAYVDSLSAPRMSAADGALERQRADIFEALDAQINKLPTEDREPFRLIQQLLARK